jgi:hypothetical protein
VSFFRVNRPDSDIFSVERAFVRADEQAGSYSDTKLDFFCLFRKGPWQEGQLDGIGAIEVDDTDSFMLAGDCNGFVQVWDVSQVRIECTAVFLVIYIPQLTCMWASCGYFPTRFWPCFEFSVPELTCSRAFAGVFC